MVGDERGQACIRLLLLFEIVRRKPMQFIKIERVVVTVPMHHHAICRRPSFFVSYGGVTYEPDMMKNSFSPVLPVPDQFATRLATSLDFFEALLFRVQ